MVEVYFVNLVNVSTILRCCYYQTNVSLFMSVKKPVRVVRKGLRCQRSMDLHVKECNKSVCMWVHFLREQFRFCFDINVDLC